MLMSGEILISKGASMLEKDRLAALHASDPPPNRVEECPICHGYFKMVEGGRLRPHPSAISGEPCRGRNPVPAKVEEYTVGFDTMYGVYYGGAWEMGKKT